jgi:6-phosphogluconolactonase/glucosamine-6-phosphate isomerase/deaminase
MVRQYSTNHINVKTSQIEIASTVEEYFRDSEFKSIMVTGGGTLKQIYRLLPYESLCEKNIYMTDERMGSHGDIASNKKMIETELFKLNKPRNWNPIQGDSANPRSEADRYAKLIPDKIDLIVLSVGLDGHIASIFPNCKTCPSGVKVAYVSDAPQPYTKRVTITPIVIRNAKKILLVALGAKKGEILAKVCASRHNDDKFPVNLGIDRTWLLDREASNSFDVHLAQENIKTEWNYV